VKTNRFNYWYESDNLYLFITKKKYLQQDLKYGAIKKIKTSRNHFAVIMSRTSQITLSLRSQIFNHWRWRSLIQSLNYQMDQSCFSSKLINIYDCYFLWLQRSTHLNVQTYFPKYSFTVIKNEKYCCFSLNWC